MNGPNSYSTLSSFAGGLSVAEWTNSGTANNGIPLSNPNPATTRADLQYTRGPDMGGGVGGLLHSKRKDANSSTYTHKFNLANGRGDIIAQTDSAGALTWTASYDASGRRPKETGSNADRQRSNSKEEDETGLVNDHHRYRDPVTLSYLTLDPAGFVDGPNLYAYVNQNPWSKFDPEGLWQIIGHSAITENAARSAGFESFARYNLQWGSVQPDLPDGPAMTGFNYGAHYITPALRSNTLTNRTHFGDLQPWHFMGRSGTDSAKEVQNRAIDFIMRNVSLYMGAHKDMPYRVRLRYLGAALHTIQDSFSPSHVTRDAKTGEIKLIQDYNLQDITKHSDSDKDKNSPYFRAATLASIRFLKSVKEGIPNAYGIKSRDPKLLEQFLRYDILKLSSHARIGVYTKYKSHPKERNP